MKLFSMGQPYTERRTQIVMVIAIAILLLNDFYLKAAYHNFSTGKISDVVGLLVFPIVIAWIFPRSARWVSTGTGIIFVIWKTSLATLLISFINQNGFFQINRTIDYTDYLALPILLLSHRLINNPTAMPSKATSLARVVKITILVPALFAICATSRAPFYSTPKGTVLIDKSYKIRMSKKETIDAIKKLGYNIDYHASPDSTKRYGRTPSYYQTDNIMIFNDTHEPIDTILNVKYALTELKVDETDVRIINVTLSEDGNVQSWQTLKYLSKGYRKIIEEKMIKKLKK